MLSNLSHHTEFGRFQYNDFSGIAPRRQYARTNQAAKGSNALRKLVVQGHFILDNSDSAVQLEQIRVSPDTLPQLDWPLSLPHLTSLSVIVAPMAGQSQEIWRCYGLPNEWKNYTQLESLELRHAALMRMPTWLPELQALRNFEAVYLKVDVFPGQLVQLTNLERLYLGAADGMITNAVVAFANFPHLTSICFGEIARVTTDAHIRIRRDRTESEMRCLEQCADALAVQAKPLRRVHFEPRYLWFLAESYVGSSDM